MPSRNVSQLLPPLLLIILSLLAPAAHAATQYIVDQLTVPLRRGPSNGHKIIHAGLPSGTALEILNEDKASGFTEVRTPSGTEGWVPTQFLTAEPAARDRLAAASKRIEALTAELATSRQSAQKETSARNSAEGVSNDLNKTVKRLENELAEIRRVSANAVATYEENKQLKEKNMALMTASNDQAQQLQMLKSNSQQTWLLSGGGLVVLGLTIGAFLKSRPKKRTNW